MKINNCCFNIIEPTVKACWEISDYCNLKCTFCFNAAHRTHEENNDILSNLNHTINQLHNYDIEHIIISGGEPLLCKDLFAIIHGLELSGFIVSLCTNATLIDESFCKELKQTNVKKITINIADLVSNKNNLISKESALFSTVLVGIQYLVKYGFDVTVNDIVFGTDENLFRDRLSFCQDYNIKKITFTLPICKCISPQYMYWPPNQVDKVIANLYCLEKEFSGIDILFNNPNCLSESCPSQRNIFGISGSGVLPHCLVKRDIKDFE